MTDQMLSVHCIDAGDRILMVVAGETHEWIQREVKGFRMLP